MSTTKNQFHTQAMVGMGVLTAVVVVLQFVASAIKFGPFSITLVLAPIIIGAALYYGWLSGAWLGAVFGIVVLISGDASAFLSINAPGTVITCILKGALAGAAAGLVYHGLDDKLKDKPTLAVIAAGIVCPVVNTGVFLLGCLVFFLDTVKEWGAGAGYENVGAYFLFGFVGLNFVIELAINLILSTTIVRIIQIARKGVSA